MSTAKIKSAIGVRESQVAFIVEQQLVAAIRAAGSLYETQKDEEPLNNLHNFMEALVSNVADEVGRMQVENTIEVLQKVLNVLGTENHSIHTEACPNRGEGYVEENDPPADEEDENNHKGISKGEITVVAMTIAKRIQDLPIGHRNPNSMSLVAVSEIEKLINVHSHE